MVFNEKFKAIESLFAEDKGFTVLKIEGRNAGDEQFYLAIVMSNFILLLLGTALIISKFYSKRIKRIILL